MAVAGVQTTLTAEERRQKQRLIVRDSIALSSLLVIAVVLSFVTYLLFHSFEHHQQELAQRWKSRGEQEMKRGRPQVALNSLRSALAYEPDDRGLEIELATALAEAGYTQEAVVYFNTLREAEPGNGLINLQLARLAAKQGNVPLAVSDYQAAIDGTWFGDGFVRRRAIRFEMSQYLVSNHRLAEARSQLLIAAGNAPEDMDVQLAVAAMLEDANDSRDALDIYRRAADHRSVRTVSLAGAAQAARALGRYMEARKFAEEATGQPDFNRQPDSVKAGAREVLTEATALLALYPSPELTPAGRARRIAHLVELVQARVNACAPTAPVHAASAPAGQPGTARSIAGSVVGAVSGAVSGAVTGTLRAAGIGPSTPLSTNPAAGTAPQPSADPIAGLRAQLGQLPAGRALTRRLERDPAFAGSTLTLVYDAARASAGCTASALTPEDALLLRIAASPDTVEQM